MRCPFNIQLKPSNEQSFLFILSQSCPKRYYKIGASPKPDFISCFDARNEAKKIKAAPALLKKLRSFD